LGVGRNLDDVGISENEALILLANDIKRCQTEASKFAWFNALSEVRQDVILSMLFNLGLPRFKGFRKMIAALARRDYVEAADQMLESQWAEQVGDRVLTLSRMMESNKYPDLM
jgi:lysozyme